MQAVDTIGKAYGRRMIGMRSLRFTLKGIREIRFIVDIGGFGKRSTSLVVGDVALS